MALATVLSYAQGRDKNCDCACAAPETDGRARKTNERTAPNAGAGASSALALLTGVCASLTVATFKPACSWLCSNHLGKKVSWAFERNRKMKLSNPRYVQGFEFSEEVRPRYSESRRSRWISSMLRVEVSSMPSLE